MANLFHDKKRTDCKSVFMDCATLTSKNLDWKIIDAILKDVEMGFIAQCLGTELYEYICGLTEKEEDLTDFEEHLLHCTRLFVTRYVEFKGHAKLAIIITNKGPQEFSDDRKTGTTSKHMYNESKYEACNCAYDKLENLIYNCIIPNCDKFPEGMVERSKLWKKVCQSIMFGPEQFVLYKPLHNDGRLKDYWSLLPYLGDIQDCELAGCIGCPGFMDVLIEAACAKEPNPAYTKLFKNIRRYLAAESLLRAATEGLLMYTGEGFKMVNSLTASKTFNAGTKEQREKQCAALKQASEMALCKIKPCLEENKDKEGFEEYLTCSVEQETEEDCEEETTHGDCDCPCPCGEEEETTSPFVVCGSSTVGLL